MKAIMTGVSLAAVISAAPAFATEWQKVAQAQPQTDLMQQEMQATTACPDGEVVTAEGAACPPETTGSLPATPNTAEAAQTDEPQDEATEMVAADGGKFIEEQGDEGILATELIGLTVYNPADEPLGDVNDVVWTNDGGIEALIVGVGGFLGIGEKQVAVAYDAIDISTDENGAKTLMLDATSDELAVAPEFMTTAEKLAMLQQEILQKAPAPAPATPPVQ